MVPFSALLLNCIVAYTHPNTETLHKSCQVYPDKSQLCPILVGQGSSIIRSLMPDTQNGQMAAWNRSGWCGLSHNVLEINFGKRYEIRKIRVKRVTTRPQPEFLKLDYFDYELGDKGDYQRYMDQKGSDNVLADESGTILALYKNSKKSKIITDRVKLTMVLPKQMKSSQKACMKIEIYYLETRENTFTRSTPSKFFNKPGVKLSFGISSQSENDWIQFAFIFRRQPSIQIVKTTWMITSISNSDAKKTKIEVLVTARTTAAERDMEQEFETDILHVTEIQLNQQQLTPTLDLMFKPNKPEGDVYYRIVVRDVTFYTQNINEEILFRFNGTMKKSPSEVSLKMHRVNPSSYASKRESVLARPMAPAASYRSILMQCKIEWNAKRNFQNGFTSQYAVDYGIANSDFTNTIRWEKLNVTDDVEKETFWIGVFPYNMNKIIAFNFPVEIDGLKISNLIAYKEPYRYDTSLPIKLYPSNPTQPDEDPSDVDDCDGWSCYMGSQPTIAGIIVGIIGALVVVAFVAAILIWRKRQSSANLGYYLAPNGIGRSSGRCSGRNGPLYRERNNFMNTTNSCHFNDTHLSRSLQHEPRYVHEPTPNRNGIPANDRNHTMPNYLPSLPSSQSVHTLDGGPQSRPNLPPPQPPQHVYEPPKTFHENSPRIYGPCGTIRYAQPDALKMKSDPPKIDAGYIQVLEFLGSGEFGEVLLVEAPIDAFPENSIGIDLPKGAKNCLAALKRLKPESSEETKKTFLAEAKLMYGLRHRNILPLLAVIPDIPALLSGYSEHGDLRQFLRRRLTCEKTNPDDPGFISNSSLLDITIQISAAMEYLESKRVVHRDLAARNCFVGRGLTVRVGDFGMSRNLYSKDYFKVTGNAVLPVRWSAWESIILGKFTTQSDVWSFGVTCFETFKLCRERPLESMTDEQVIHRMVSLYKEKSSLTVIPWLSMPELCPQSVWEVIMNCWNRQASKRPTFKALNQQLNEQMKQIENQTITNSVHI